MRSADTKRIRQALTALLLMSVLFVSSFAAVFADSETQVIQSSISSSSVEGADNTDRVNNAYTANSVNNADNADNNEYTVCKILTAADDVNNSNSVAEETLEKSAAETPAADQTSADPAVETPAADQTSADPAAETPAADQTLNDPASETSADPAAETNDSASETPAPAVSRIIQKGKFYYYKDPKTGKIRKKAGFVKDLGSLYYIKKGGKIITGKTFTVNGKRYRAAKNGVIKTGVYKWGKNYCYSALDTGVWIRTEKIIKWKKNRYYIMKGGNIYAGGVFTYKSIPYSADSKGRLTDLKIPDGDGNPVIAVAKKQVGVMTGRTYWRWYYKTKFIDTDRTPWCGAFVAWCFNKAGLYKKISAARKYGPLGYVPSYSRYANKKKKWIKVSTARAGDIIVFGRNAHVGLVEGVSDGLIYTIEGNAGPTAAFRSGKPGAVIRKVYRTDSKWIKGVIRVM